MMNNQNVIIKMMVENDNNFDQIKQELHRKFGECAYKDSTIYEKIRLTRCATDITTRKPYESERMDMHLANEIKNLLNEFPFSSVRSIALMTKKPIATIHRYLTQVLHMKYRVTRWLPHKLTEQNLKERVQKSNELYDILETSKSFDYRDIITGDQSWILYKYNPHGKWCLDGEENPEFERDQITRQKFMITIIWGVWGFFVVDMLPHGMSYNSSYFISNILDVLNEKKQIIWPKSGRRKVWLHLDNCRIHNSKMTMEKIQKIQFKRTPHPAYSPDIAPSDFYLFGRVKKELEGFEFEAPQEVFDKVIEILDGISYEERLSVFEAWQHRLDFVRNIGCPVKF